MAFVEVEVVEEYFVALGAQEDLTGLDPLEVHEGEARVAFEDVLLQVGFLGVPDTNLVVNLILRD